ncbi:MAG: biotin-dependent carboxyltransferase family protein [Cyclobacteriaceae bacterium]
MMKGKIHFKKAGLLTTIQDQGRLGMRQFGVPVSGHMDKYSAGLCNLILNNPVNTPLIEITLQGPEIAFDAPTTICLTGAEMSPQLNKLPILLNKRVPVNAGDVLSFGALKFGVRCYLGIYGGFESELVLESFSQYKGITEQHQIKKGQTLGYHSSSQLLESNSRLVPNHEHFESDILEATKGPEFDLFGFSKKPQNTECCIQSNDRMGYVLSSDPIDLSHQQEIITSPVIPGTVQLTPSGKLIVLMRDAQVTGGYPRVLQLTEQSINRLAQKRSGEKVKLVLKGMW